MQVNYNDCGSARTAPLYQYDYGQTLTLSGFDLPASFEVQFSNDPNGESVTQIGSDSVVQIPDSMLLSGENVYAWVFLHKGEADGETVFYIEIPVTGRAKITDEEPTPAEQGAITQLVAALNAAVESAGNAAQTAEAAYNTMLAVGLTAAEDGAGNVTITIGGE